MTKASALRRWREPATAELVLFVLVLAVSATAHAFNMFHFPYYEDDEGTYVAQAWSLVEHGQLAPYTYWYDHAPAGWMLIGLWAKLTGGFFTFGFSINSGRVLMLVLHVASTAMVYALVRGSLVRSQGSRSRPLRVAPTAAATIAALVFSLSPLAIYFQRRVLLDNIAVFWILACCCLLMFSRARLGRVAMAALCLGIAVLSKETAIFFFPSAAWLLWKVVTRAQRRYAAVLFVGVSGAVGALYVLFATLKGELFPPGTLLGNNHPHVSLLGTMAYQMSRGGNGGLLSPHSDFRSYLHLWSVADPVLLLAGLAAVGLCTLVALRDRWALFPASLALGYLAFLAHGGLVLEFYVVPLVPTLAISLGYVIGRAIAPLERLRVTWAKRALVFALTAAALGGVAAEAAAFSGDQHGYDIYTADQTRGQIASVQWLRTKADIPYASIDMYGYVDLYGRPHPGFRRVDYYWKIDRDPAVRDRVLHDNPSRVDYMLVTPQVMNDIKIGAVPFNARVLSESRYVRTFPGTGWWVELWANESPRRILDSAWRYFKRRFIRRGVVRDPEHTGVQQSELQSLALLEAVWADDPPAFSSLWRWTQTRLAQADGLHATHPGAQASSTACELRMLLALTLAADRWHRRELLMAARAEARAIVANDLVEIRGHPYLEAGPIGRSATKVPIDATTVDPPAIRALVTLDSSRRLSRLEPDMLAALAACARLPAGGAPGRLPSDGCTLAGNSSAPQETAASGYGADARQVPFALALDWMWSSSPSDLRELGLFGSLRKPLLARKLDAGYDHTARPTERYQTAAAYAPALGLLIRAPAALARTYRATLLSKFYEDASRSYWEDPNNPETQLWGWLGTALYAHSLPSFGIVPPATESVSRQARTLASRQLRLDAATR